MDADGRFTVYGPRGLAYRLEAGVYREPEKIFYRGTVAAPAKAEDENESLSIYLEKDGDKPARPEMFLDVFRRK